jgi:CHASE2 domain-containing sensor protein
LQSLENHYPCASWLPVIFQHSTQPTLTWDGLRGRNPSPPPTTFPSPQFLRPRKLKLRHAVLITLAVTGLVLGARSLGWLQPMELWAYDQFMQHQTHVATDPNLLIVAVDKADIQRFGKPLSDRALYQLLVKLEKYQPKVIGLDIFRDQPQPGEGWNDLTKILQTSDRVITVCSDVSDGDIAIAPPPKVPTDRVSYVDTMLHDPDNRIRRYAIAQEGEGETSCSTPYSFALQLIRRFLPSYTNYQLQPEIGMSIGNRHLATVQANVGGYRLTKDDTFGYQILIDFRPYQIARTASLTDIFNAQDVDLRDWVRDRIILIGYVGETSEDLHLTPRGQQSGVIIHAYMVSQMLRAITDNQPLISSWSETIEGFWILGWSAIAGWIVWVVQSKPIRIILLGTALLILVGSSFLLFFQSTWVPIVPASLALFLTSSVAISLTTYFQHTHT